MLGRKSGIYGIAADMGGLYTLQTRIAAGEQYHILCRALDVCEAYMMATKGMKDPAPIYYSHITGIYDEYLQNYVKENRINVSPDALWQAGISMAKKTYRMVKEKAYPVGFIGGGARGLHHFTEMVGADCVVTIKNGLK